MQVFSYPAFSKPTLRFNPAITPARAMGEIGKIGEVGEVGELNVRGPLGPTLLTDHYLLPTTYCILTTTH